MNIYLTIIIVFALFASCSTKKNEIKSTGIQLGDSIDILYSMHELPVYVEPCQENSFICGYFFNVKSKNILSFEDIYNKNIEKKFIVFYVKNQVIVDFLVVENEMKDSIMEGSGCRLFGASGSAHTF